MSRPSKAANLQGKTRATTAFCAAQQNDAFHSDGRRLPQSVNSYAEAALHRGTKATESAVLHTAQQRLHCGQMQRRTRSFAPKLDFASEHASQLSIHGAIFETTGNSTRHPLHATDNGCIQ